MSEKAIPQGLVTEDMGAVVVLVAPGNKAASQQRVTYQAMGTMGTRDQWVPYEQPILRIPAYLTPDNKLQFVDILALLCGCTLLLAWISAWCSSAHAQFL